MFKNETKMTLDKFIKIALQNCQVSSLKINYCRVAGPENDKAKTRRGTFCKQLRAERCYRVLFLLCLFSLSRQILFFQRASRQKYIFPH